MRVNQELETCKHFLVDSEIDNGRHRVFNCAREILDAHTLSHKVDTVFEKLKCAAKLNLSLGFVLKNSEDGTCRYYYAHENNTMMEQSKLAATKEELVKIKSVLSNTDVMEACTKERTNLRWKFNQHTNVKVFAALLREIPMECKDAVLPEPLTINHTVNCLTYEENTIKPNIENLCPFRVLTLHLHGNWGDEEETSKMFTVFLGKTHFLMEQ